MYRILALVSLLVLAACGSPIPQDGNAIYRISARDTAKIQFRMLDGVNALRVSSGMTELRLSSELNAAAATHAQDMSLQNRPWHFGSDGSSPLDRAARAGYQGRLLGENISETYETELQTLSAWMAGPETRGVLLDRNATDMGFAWFQEPSGKIWWTLVTGDSNRPVRVGT